MKHLLLFVTVMLLQGCFCGDTEPAYTGTRNLDVDGVPIEIRVTSYHTCRESGNHFVFGATNSYGYNLYAAIDGRDPVTIYTGTTGEALGQGEVDELLEQDVPLYFSPDRTRFLYHHTDYDAVDVYYMLPNGNPFKDEHTTAWESDPGEVNWDTIPSPEQKALRMINDTLYDHSGNYMFWYALGDNAGSDELNEALVQLFEREIRTYPTGCIADKMKMGVFSASQVARIERVMIDFIRSKVYGHSNYMLYLTNEEKELVGQSDNEELLLLVDSLNAMQ